MRVAVRHAVAGVLVAWAAGGAAGAQPAGRVETRPLEVPYVAQSAALCGGAAAAMLERYWGRRQVFAEDFAPLLNAARDGIETGALTQAMARRGWHALSFGGSLAVLGGHLGQGRPVIALIQVSPRRYHYVVVVAAGPDAIVFHDPAAQPYETLSPEAFDARWAASDRWMLLVLPHPDRETVLRSSAARPASGASLPCRDLLADAVAHASDRAFDRAEAALARARTECPEASEPLRELAGIRLLQRRAADAVPLAREAVSRDPGDLHAWRVLGTAEFLAERPLRALDAWNRAGEPLADLVRTEGLTRTRHRVVIDRAAIAPGARVTRGVFTRAARRLEEVPAVALARLDLVPVGNGLADMRAAVVERPLMPSAPLALGSLAARAAVTREIQWQVSSPSGGGERFDVAARWWENRPAVSVALSVPVSRPWLSGTLRIEGQFERESYAAVLSGIDRLVEDRRSASLGLSDWATGGLRWEGEVRLDRWAGRPPALGVGGSLEHRLADRFGLRGKARLWPAPGIVAFDAGARWRWRQAGVDRVLTDFDAGVVSDRAPRTLWPGAGTGHGRPLLLRAHPLLDDGTIAAGGIGRRLLHGSVEGRHPVAGLGPLQIAVAAFADTAAIWRGDGPAVRHLDGGIGVRVRIPGEGTLRVDYARGLVDGRNALSAGWILPWPSWP